MAQSTPTANLGWHDFFSTTLSSAITASDTTIPLTAAPTPTEGFLVIEPDSSTNREIIMYTSVSGSSVICGSVDDRGISGTTARAHSSGAIVKMNTVADMFEALQSGNGLSTSAVTTTKIADRAVTSEKLDATVAFRAYDSGGTTLTDATPVAINFATEDYDLGSDFAASAFTAPYNGVYNFSAAVSIDSAVSTGVEMYIAFYVDGTLHTLGTRTTGLGTDSGLNIAADIKLTAGQVVTVRFYQNSAGNEATNTGSDTTWFAGHLVGRTA